MASVELRANVERCPGDARRAHPLVSFSASRCWRSASAVTKASRQGSPLVGCSKASDAYPRNPGSRCPPVDGGTYEWLLPVPRSCQ